MTNTVVPSPTFSRRGLFRRLAGARVAEAVRPPGALPESRFQDACTGCGDCVRACPQGILGTTRGYPEVHFAAGGCDFCGACARACRTGALTEAACAPGTFAHRVAIGAGCLSALYAVFGGRAFCAWVCPVNVLTDGAHRLRVRLGVRQGLSLPRGARWWALATVVGVSALTGAIAWEAVNPVTLLHRELVFGMVFSGSLAWMLLAGVVLFDVFAANRGWCGHLCPMGAAYGLIGKASLTRVSARGRADCDQCMACYHVCPEPQVLTPALKGGAGASPVVLSGDCTNCGRCIDVCHRDIFAFTHRFDHRTDARSTPDAPAAPAARAAAAPATQAAAK